MEWRKAERVGRGKLSYRHIQSYVSLRVLKSVRDSRYLGDPSQGNTICLELIRGSAQFLYFIFREMMRPSFGVVPVVVGIPHSGPSDFLREISVGS